MDWIELRYDKYANSWRYFRKVPEHIEKPPMSKFYKPAMELLNWGKAFCKK
jgi:hypothetical protein